MGKWKQEIAGGGRHGGERVDGKEKETEPRYKGGRMPAGYNSGHWIECLPNKYGKNETKEGAIFHRIFDRYDA